MMIFQKLAGHIEIKKYIMAWGFPGGTVKNQPADVGRRHKRCRFDPWVGKMPWRRKWQPTPVFLPGELHGPEEPGGLWPIESQRVRHD